MAGETLRTAIELLGEFPDNTSGLIDAVNSRDFIVSVAPGVAFMEDDPADTPIVIPITDGVPTDILAQLTAPQFIANFWQLDGSNGFIPDYSGVVIPPATIRLLTGSMIIEVEKVGGGTADYTFQGTQGGVITGNPILRSISTITTLVFSGVRLYDVSIGGAISVQVEGTGTSDDLTLSDLRVSIESVLI